MTTLWSMLHTWVVMTVSVDVLRLSRLVDSDPGLRLLRADSAPFALSILTRHLGDDVRRLSSDELYEKVEEDLAELRSAGFELNGTAQYYVTQWRNTGFLVRRSIGESREETLELSSSALRAVRFVQDLQSPAASVTESRLANLSEQIRQLAIETDPQSERRLKRLKEQQRSIERQIAAIRAGRDDPMEKARATERLLDILGQARTVPDDFARVRERFESLNIDLREQILDSDGHQSRVLDDIFRGVDYIAESDAGRTFRAFTELILDSEVSGAFEGDVDAVLGRPFAHSLDVHERILLRNFISTLKELTLEIQEVTTSFARGLRRYVQSQDYQRDRALRGQLQAALLKASEISESVKPFEPVGLELPLTRVSMSHLSGLKLHDPEEFDAAKPVQINAHPTADLNAIRALARLTEIDFDELTRNVNEVLTERESASVAEILDAFPATQGVASVAGLLSLAATYGTVEKNEEQLLWQGADGKNRSASTQVHRFTGRLQ